MKKISLLVFTLLLILFGFFIPSDSFAASIIFEDDFNNSTESSFKWIRSGPQLFNGDNSQANWKFENGVVGMKIVNKGFQFNELIPTSWNNSLMDYQMEFDMKLVGGVDTNFVFRYQDHSNWYGVHGINNQFFLQKAGGSWSQAPDAKNVAFNSNQFYHFKVIVQGESMKVYINDALMWEITDIGTHLTSGLPGLQASTGAVPSSEVIFDNFKITSLDSTLPVPYFSQNDDPWGPQEYDSAISLGMNDPNMNRWGCAVTSAAMILNYHGMTNFGSELNSLQINPGTLNQWLKANSGYTEYGTIKWGVIGALTQRLYNIGLASYKLLPHPFANHSLLQEDLVVKMQAGHIIGAPAIIKVTKTGLTSSHYVVATGITSNSIAINDPESWNYPDLLQYDNNDYHDLHRYIPSQTDLSNIYMAVNPDAEILLTDTEGKKAGKLITNGVTNEFNEIPRATYVFEEPISNPNENGDMEQIGTGANVLYLSTPLSGEYTITVSSKTANSPYLVDVTTFEKDGEFLGKNIEGITGSSNPDSFQINYEQENPSIIERTVTFQSALTDLEELWESKQIKKKAVYIVLREELELAQKASQKKKGKSTTKIALLLAKKTLEKNEKQFTNEGYEIMKYDIDYLLKNL